MRSLGQAGMEYLVNFGWALVLVLSIIGALFFLPSENVSLSSSVPDRLSVEESFHVQNLLAVKLRNPASEKIELVGLSLSGSFEEASCSVKGTALPENEPFSLEIGPGGEINLECEPIESLQGELTLFYSEEASQGPRPIIISPG